MWRLLTIALMTVERKMTHETRTRHEPLSRQGRRVRIVVVSFRVGYARAFLLCYAFCDCKKGSRPFADCFIMMGRVLDGIPKRDRLAKEVRTRMPYTQACVVVVKISDAFVLSTFCVGYGRLYFTVAIHILWRFCGWLPR